MFRNKTIVPPKQSATTITIMRRNKCYWTSITAFLAFFCLLVIVLPIYLFCNLCPNLFFRWFTIILIVVFLLNTISAIFFFFTEKKKEVKVKIYHITNKVIH